MNTVITVIVIVFAGLMALGLYGLELKRSENVALMANDNHVEYAAKLSLIKAERTELKTMLSIYKERAAAARMSNNVNCDKIPALHHK